MKCLVRCRSPLAYRIFSRIRRNQIIDMCASCLHRRCSSLIDHLLTHFCSFESPPQGSYIVIARVLFLPPELVSNFQLSNGVLCSVPNKSIPPISFCLTDTFLPPRDKVTSTLYCDPLGAVGRTKLACLGREKVIGANFPPGGGGSEQDARSGSGGLTQSFLGGEKN